MKLLLCTALVPLAAFAQDIKPFDVKVGLWESTTTMEMTGLPAMPSMPQLSEEQMAKMPPQARAQMEAMMKSKGGIGAPRTTTSKSCVTKETLNQAFNMNQQGCTTKLVSSSASQQKIHMECKQGQATSSGDMTLDRVDAEHALGLLTMKTAMNQPGAPSAVDMKVTFATKYLGTDCGDVKPVMAK